MYIDSLQFTILCLPALFTLVEHHGLLYVMCLFISVHALWTTPLYWNGNLQGSPLAGPSTVMQLGD